jgi:hypothetical protein
MATWHSSVKPDGSLVLLPRDAAGGCCTEKRGSDGDVFVSKEPESMSTRACSSHSLCQGVKSDRFSFVSMSRSFSASENTRSLGYVDLLSIANQYICE